MTFPDPLAGPIRPSVADASDAPASAPAARWRDVPNTLCSAHMAGQTVEAMARLRTAADGDQRIFKWVTYVIDIVEQETWC